LFGSKGLEPLQDVLLTAAWLSACAGLAAIAILLLGNLLTR
jgi:hypothetical protein